MSEQPEVAPPSMVIRYNGDQSAELPGRVMGPDRLGMFMVVVSAEFDAEPNRTTVHWRPVTPEGLAERVYDNGGQAYLLELTSEVVRRRFIEQLRRDLGVPS